MCMISALCGTANLNAPTQTSRYSNIRVKLILKMSNGKTVYIDGVWDMFHVGHLRAIRKCAAFGDRVIVGVVSDDDCESYKRRPIIPAEDRCAIVSAIKGVERVVCPCPLVMTDEFIDENEIVCVVHSFSNEADEQAQRSFFEAPIRRNIFRTVPYYGGTSTTDIVRRAALAKSHRWNNEVE